MIQFKKRLLRINPKQLMVAAGFVAAMAGAAGLGIATKQYTHAASPRDCDSNAVLRCGADDPREFIEDVKSNNTRTQTAQPDIKAIYADARMGGLTAGDYERFANTARMGKVYKDGRGVVDGYTVLTDANSLGREKFNDQRKAMTIGDKTYYYSATSASFASSSIDAMFMFDSNGVVETVILTSCGNPVWGSKVTPTYSCKTLNQRSVPGKLNTYEFNTTVGSMKNASVNKVVYDFGDGSTPVTKTNPSEYVPHTFTKSAEVTVTVYFNVPGGKVVPATVVANCKKKITFIAPFYSCDIVLPRELNTEKTKFRFTVKTSQGNGAALKDADFTLDGSSTVTGVTTKDEAGNIYKEYEFARDGKDHTVVVKVNFNVANGVQSKQCQSKVTSGKAPVCIVNGKEYPVGAPECQPYKCPIPGKEGKPKEECNEVLPAALPVTGMGGVAGLFAGTSILGAVAHRVLTSRRRR